MCIRDRHKKDPYRVSYNLMEHFYACHLNDWGLTLWAPPTPHKKDQYYRISDSLYMGHFVYDLNWQGPYPFTVKNKVCTAHQIRCETVASIHTPVLVCCAHLMMGVSCTLWMVCSLHFLSVLAHFMKCKCTLSLCIHCCTLLGQWCGMHTYSIHECHTPKHLQMTCMVCTTYNVIHINCH